MPMANSKMFGSLVKVKLKKNSVSVKKFKFDNELLRTVINKQQKYKKEHCT